MPAAQLNKYLYLLGQLISHIGSNLFLIAMVIWLKKSNLSESYISYFLLISSTTSLLFSSFSGVWSDSIGSKKMMVITDIINGITMLVISYLIYFSINKVDINVILFLTFLSSLMNTLYAPASLSIIGKIAKTDEVIILSSWSSNIIEASKILGRALAGIIIIYISPALLIFINGISFLISGLLEMKIKELTISTDNKESKKWDEFKEGFNYLLKKKELVFLFISAAITNFFIAINTPLLPTIINDYLGKDLSWYGLVMSGYGFGALIGGYFARKACSEIKKYFNYFLILQGFPLLFIPFCRSVLLLLLFLIILGFFYVYIQVNIITYITSTTDKDFRGRVFSIMITFVGIFMPLSYLFTSYITADNMLTIKRIYLFGGIVVPITWVWFCSKVKIY